MNLRAGSPAAAKILREECTISNLLTPLSIYVLTSILGLLVYFALIRTMRSTKVVSAPELPFFILFFTSGGWLLVLLTVWFWEWSGLASIGMLYLILIAPVLTALMAWRLRSYHTLSGFHRCACFVSGAYTCAIAFGVPVALRTHLIDR
jgi:hypothetical protein